MRSTDDQLKEIMQKSKTIKAKHDSKVAIAAEALSSVACLILMITVIILLPGFNAGSDIASKVQYGSLLLHSSYIGYVIVGALAFILGILVTLLCAQVRKLNLMEGTEKS